MSAQERLAGAVAGLRTRGRSGGLDRWLLIVGGGLLPVGVLVIALGWYGASHSPWLFEQVPYLISGGLLGLGLVVVGGFVYFAYWLTLLVREGREQAGRAETALARIEGLLAAGAAGGQAASVATGRAALVATARGSMVHRPDCPVVTGKTDLRTVGVETPGLAPCRICDPLG